MAGVTGGSYYDAQADALYVRISDGGVARTVDLGDGLLIDYDASGEAVGVEILGLARR